MAGMLFYDGANALTVTVIIGFWVALQRCLAVA